MQHRQRARRFMIDEPLAGRGRVWQGGSMVALFEEAGTRPMVLKTTGALRLNDEEFFEFCARNREWRIERSAKGDILIMPPVGGSGSSGNARLIYFFEAWAMQDGTGRVFDSSGGFRLRNGATRSPDVSWVRNERLAALSEREWSRFLPLCPDFVLELRSPSDLMEDLHAKMEEYMACGARLGWLLDPQSKEVFVYRPQGDPQKLSGPAQISGESVLNGFVLDVWQVWAAMER
jgi:Uma2 family endonuclease